ncbi:MAG: sensor domain-containing diguanylate cyclase [Dehalococcoidia bacterium]|nr:sensor domain-containing diguanylate cyclase [Dehalococcoidia bacterium]
MVGGKIEALGALAQIVAAPGPSQRKLVQALDIIRDVTGLDRVFLAYAQDSEFLCVGDSSGPDSVGTGQMGIWLLDHQMQLVSGPVTFEMRGSRVEAITPYRKAKGRIYAAFPLSTDSASGQMLLVKAKREGELTRALSAFVDAAFPSLALLLEQQLSAWRVARQKEQMTALANAGELLIQAEQMESVLSDLATAVSSSTGYPLVSIDVYDDASKRIGISALNKALQTRSSLGALWKGQVFSMTYSDELMQAAMRTRKPLFISDIQSDSRLRPEERAFFRNAHIFSAGQFPLVFGDEFLGTLRVGSQHPRSFNPQEVRVLEGFAAQLSVALKAVRMYKALGESEKQLKAYSQRLQSSMEIQHRLARTDPLTGIPNRRYIDEVVGGECARAARHGTSLSLAIADIDRFKDVNDTYGHKAGDEALVQLADLARRTCRRGDMVGRYGGDEFLFVLPETGLAAAKRFGERFRSEVAGRLFSIAADCETKLRVSIGVTAIDGEKPQEAAALVREADEALYQAKCQGGDRTVLYESARRAA